MSSSSAPSAEVHQFSCNRKEVKMNKRRPLGIHFLFFWAVRLWENYVNAQGTSSIFDGFTLGLLSKVESC